MLLNVHTLATMKRQEQFYDKVYLVKRGTFRFTGYIMYRYVVFDV